MEDLKDRIKLVRNHFNLTQSEFGARVGVKGNTIGNYETDLRKPSEAVIFSICREFGVNEEWLRTGVGGEDNMFTNYLPMTRHITVLDMLWKMHQHPKRLR